MQLNRDFFESHVSNANPIGFCQSIANIVGNSPIVVSEKECKQFELDTSVAKLIFAEEKFNMITSVAHLCQGEIIRLMGHYSRTGVPSIISSYRRQIRELFGEEHFALHFMKAPEEILQKNMSEYRRKIRTCEVHAFSAEKAEEYVKTASALLNEKAVAKKVVGLCALSGRRPIEVMLTGKFSPSDKGEKWAIFSGQAKARGDERTYHIPLLCNYNVFANGVAGLRVTYNFNDVTIPHGKTLAMAINDRWASEMGRITRQTLGVLFDFPLKTYDLRKIYCAIQADWHKPNNLDTFVSDILGHSEEDLITQRSYKTFKVVGNNPVPAKAAFRLLPPLPTINLIPGNRHASKNN